MSRLSENAHRKVFSKPDEQGRPATAKDFKAAAERMRPGAQTPNPAVDNDAAVQISRELTQTIARLGEPKEDISKTIELLIPYATGEAAMPGEEEKRAAIQKELTLHMPQVAEVLARRYMRYLKANPPDWTVLFAKHPELTDDLQAYFTGKKKLPNDPEKAQQILSVLERVERAIRMDLWNEFFEKHQIPAQLRPYIIGGRRSLYEGPFALSGTSLKDAEKQLRDLERRIPNLFMTPVPQGVPFRAPRSQPDDLPPMPGNIELLLAEHPDIAVKTRALFINSAAALKFHNDETGKFVEMFLALFEESGRTHMAASRIQMRTQLENAFWALASYGIVKFDARPARFGGDTVKGRLNIRINIREFAQHVEAFLALEKTHRLEAELASAPSARRAEIEIEIKSLERARAEAEHLLQNVGKRLGIKKPRTIVEALGNRMWVDASSLPVFNSPQTADTETKAPLRAKSITAALEEIRKRSVSPEAKTLRLSKDLEDRYARMLSTYQQIDDIAARVKFVISIAQEQGIDSEETRDAMYGTFTSIFQAKQQLAYERDEALKTIERAVGAKKEVREGVFGSFAVQAEKLIYTLDTQLTQLVSILNSDSTLSKDAVNTLIADVNKSVEDLGKAKIEIQQNRELIALALEAVKNPNISREDLAEIIAGFLSEESLGE